ncbi:MAG: class I SAM-dependent methyltransferase [Thermodesulfobacteriota bacterium]
MNNPTFEKEYFEKYYTDYERQNSAKKLDFYRRLVEGAAGGKTDPSILEIGCAFGKFLPLLGAGWHKYGMDVSEFAIGQARIRAPEAKFAVSAMPHIPFKETFDVIAAFDVLEHVPCLEEVIASVKARLAPSGHFIFVVPVYDSVTGPLIHLLDRDITHIHKKSRRFWLDWAGAHFEISDWWGIYRYLFPFGYHLHKPTKIFRHFTPAIAVVARAKPEPR